jgi:hypothetical protein
MRKLNFIQSATCHDNRLAYLTLICAAAQPNTAGGQAENYKASSTDQHHQNLCIKVVLS